MVELEIPPIEKSWAGLLQKWVELMFLGSTEKFTVAAIVMIIIVALICLTVLAVRDKLPFLHKYHTSINNNKPHNVVADVIPIAAFNHYTEEQMRQFISLSDLMTGQSRQIDGLLETIARQSELTASHTESINSLTDRIGEFVDTSIQMHKDFNEKLERIRSEMEKRQVGVN